MRLLRPLLTAAFAACLTPLPAQAEYAVFDSNTDSIALANGTTLGTTLTIEAVFAQTSTTTGALYFEQFDGQEAKELAVSGNNVYGSGFASGAITTGHSASVAVAPRVFHHVAFVRDGAQERLYLDGTLVGSRAVTNADISDAANPTFPAAIGAARYAPQVLIEPSFIGVLDSLRVSTTARYTGGTITAPTGDMSTDGDTLLLMNFDLADVTGNVVADLSGNGRNGTLGTTFPGATLPEIVATAPLNQRPTAGDVSAVPFTMSTDGVNDFASVPHGPMFDALEAGDEVTFEGWVRVQAYAGATPHTFFDKHEATGDGGWAMDTSTNATGLAFASQSGSFLLSNSPTGQIVAQEWTHVAVTLNQVTLEGVLYKNGEEIRRATLPARLKDTDGEALFFGFSPSGGDEFNNGNFSEVRFWNRVLPGAEIKQRMFTQATGRESGLVSAWSMDEGSGTTLGNRVAGGPVGTFAGATAAPTWTTLAPPVSRQRQGETTAMDNAVTFALRGTDFDGDALLATIKSLPTNGALFQFDGTPIVAANTAVTDALNRVTYVPGSGFLGVATLTFSMSDATLESADATLSVDVTAAAITRTTWSAGDDFFLIEKPDDANDSSNPNAVVPQWSYGTRTTIAGTGFTALTPAQHTDAGGHADLEGYSFDSSGNMYVNTGTSPIVLNFGPGPLQPIQPREMMHQPGGFPSGTQELPVTRWTAPYAGTFAIDATWRHLDFNGGDGVSPNIVVNGTPLGQNVALFPATLFRANRTTYEVLTLNAGDIVDFVTGKGPGSSVTFDTTGFSAKITRVRNVYDAGKAISRWTGNPNGVWRYGAKASLDGALSLFQLSDRTGGSANWHFFPSSTNFGVPLVSGSGGSQYFMSPGLGSPAPFAGLNFATVRFTAPKAGRYRTFGFFSMGDVGSVDVHLRRGTEALFDTIITGTNSLAPFDRVVDLSAGQTLDLIMGPNGALANDNTGERFFVMELPAPQPSTVVHYRFDDGPGAVGAMLDSGPYLLHGTTAGTLTHSTDRAANPETGTFSLDATGDSNYGQINDTALLHQQGDFTVEMFFKPNDPYNGSFGSPVFSALAAKVNTTASGSFLGGFEINRAHTGEVGGVISFGGGTGVGIATTSTTAIGQWHHVALVMDRDVSGTTDELRLYVNGVLQTSTQGVWPAIFWGDQPLYIGAANFNPGPAGGFRRNFDGHIDEFRFSSAALTPAQMLSNLAPTAITLNDDKVKENRPAGEVVGTLGGTDPNVGDTLTFTLVPGAGSTDNASFTIVGNELRTTAVFDYTTQPTYAVRLRATDTGGKFFEQAFTITVLDAPVLVMPASPLIAEATGPAGAVVTFTVSATDTEDDPDPTATAVPPSGSTFPLGDTPVLVSATDLDGTTTTDSFIVRVRDTTAPVITPPANITVTATSPLGAVVNFTANASDLVDGTFPATANPPSGSLFPIGLTPVNLTAQDVAGNPATPASFTVEVLPDPNGAVLYAETARQGGAVPGVPGATFVSFGVPAIDRAGNVAVKARIASTSGSQDAIVKLPTGGVLARIGGFAPDAAGVATGEMFKTFKDPQVSAGSVGFLAKLAGATVSTANDWALFVHDGTTLRRVAREGETAPGTAGATFRSLATFSLQGSEAAWLAKLTGAVTSLDDLGLWMARPGSSPALAFREGQLVGVKAVKSFKAFSKISGSPAVSRTHTLAQTLLLPVEFSDKSRAVLSVHDDAPGFTISTLAATGGATDATAQRTWKSFGAPGGTDTASFFAGKAVLQENNVSRAAILAGLAGDHEVLAIANGAAVDGSGAQLPGVSMKAFKDAAVEPVGGVRLAWPVKLAGTGVLPVNDDALYVADAIGMFQVVREGSPAFVPGETWGAVKGFGFMASATHGPVFLAQLIGPSVTAVNDLALYATGSTGALREALREDRPILIGVTPKTVRTFKVLATASGSSGVNRSLGAGRIVAQVTYADGTQALVEAVVP